MFRMPWNSLCGCRIMNHVCNPATCHVLDLVTHEVGNCGKQRSGSNQQKNNVDCKSGCMRMELAAMRPCVMIIPMVLIPRFAADLPGTDPAPDTEGVVGRQERGKDCHPTEYLESWTL